MSWYKKVHQTNYVNIKSFQLIVHHPRCSCLNQMPLRSENFWLFSSAAQLHKELSRVSIALINGVLNQVKHQLRRCALGVCKSSNQCFCARLQQFYQCTYRSISFVQVSCDNSIMLVCWCLHSIFFLLISMVRLHLVDYFMS